MSTEEKNQGTEQENTQTQETTSESQEQTSAEIKLSKEEYDALKSHEATVGSLKREQKQLKKQLEEAQQTSESSTAGSEQTEEFGLLQKTYLQSAGIHEDDEVELARDIQKRTGMEWDQLAKDDYFQHKLQALRDSKANAAATDVDGGSGASETKSKPEYWIQKGTPPTPDDVPDRKKRAVIVKKMREHEKNKGGRFYNE